MKEGQVIKSTGKWYNVYNADENTSIDCVLKGNFKTKIKNVTNPIAVGDIVSYIVNEEGGGIIQKIHKRDNYIVRCSTKHKRKIHILASNVDQVVIIATLKSPRTSLGFIDRVLVAAESFYVPSHIFFNKADLYNDEENDRMMGLIDIYNKVRYNAISYSCFDSSCKELAFDIFKGSLSLLVGHSGVGKSTLLNQLSSNEIQKTRGISKFSGKGVHTTTFSEIITINDDIRIIDSPGIKEWVNVDIDSSELGGYFPDIRGVMGGCKFSNCKHDREPGCEVKKCVADGLISESRYSSYMSMIHPVDNRR